jgi:hypothetical protein
MTDFEHQLHETLEHLSVKDDDIHYVIDMIKQDRNEERAAWGIVIIFCVLMTAIIGFFIGAKFG